MFIKNKREKLKVLSEPLELQTWVTDHMTYAEYSTIVDWPKKCLEMAIFRYELKEKMSI